MITLRTTEHKHYTSGIIEHPNGDVIRTLELPWRNNEIGKSCIPAGIYVVDRDYTGKQTWYRFRDAEVAPRSAIEIHPANRLHQLQGCIAPCMEIRGGVHTSDPVGVDSIEACRVLMSWFGDDSFVLRIVRN